MQAAIDSNEWIVEYISSKNIKYYDYKHFSNLEVIGKGGFGKVYRANWKNIKQPFALKSFNDFNDVSVKEIVREVKADTICVWSISVYLV